MPRKAISPEALLDLQRSFAPSPRGAHRDGAFPRGLDLLCVSEPTLYRLLRQRRQPRSVGRSDRGCPVSYRKLSWSVTLSSIAALKVRTSNRKGRHLSTSEAIRLLEDYGLDTPEGHVQAPKGVLKTPTVNAYLKAWGLNWQTLRRNRQRFAFRRSRAMSCGSLISVPLISNISRPRPGSMRDEGSRPSCRSAWWMIAVVWRTRYHCAYGEAVEVALQFLFNAMAPKADDRFPFNGRPAYLYADNGPVTRSHVFKQVNGLSGHRGPDHLHGDHDGRRTTARAKGKVERPFRTVKEAHETLYHFHQPQTEAEANAWLFNYLLRYNDGPIVASRIRAWRTGYSICRPKACGRCAVGSGFVPLHGNRKPARWRWTPVSASRGCATKSIRS